MIRILQKYENMKEETEINIPKEFTNKLFWQSLNPMSITRATDGMYVDVNESFTEFFGRRREEVIGNTAADIAYATSLERLKILEEINEKGFARNITITVRDKKGDLRCALVNTLPVEIKNQVYWLTVGTDISDLNPAAKISHEDALIKSLNSIKGAGVVLIRNHQKKQPSLCYMNEEAKMVLKTHSLDNLLHTLSENDSAYLSIGPRYYHIKNINHHRRSPMKLIVMERMPDTICIREKLTILDLTPRQKEIAFLAATGYSNREIAGRFCITEYTVKDHLKKIFHTLGVKKRSEISPKLFHWR